MSAGGDTTNLRVQPFYCDVSPVGEVLVDNVLLITLVIVGRGGHGLLGLFIGICVLHTAGDGNIDLNLLTFAM